MAKKSGRKRPARPGRADTVQLYGRHAVLAALANPRREALRLHATANALAAIAQALPRGLDVREAGPGDISRLAGRDAVHQGLLLECRALGDLALDEALAPGAGPLVMLDQVTDPMNVGAILRSMAAFGASALVTQARNSPAEGGALARAASGALDIVPWVRVVNLSRALEEISRAGYWRIGLAGDAPQDIGEVADGQPTCLVLGAEGRGLRPNIAAHCDRLARIPIDARMDSLNVSNAAAVALYALTAP